jgi:peptidoglycan/LPS O-acetylase OafA/YrhL
VAIMAVLAFHCNGEIQERGLRPLQPNLPHWVYLVENGDRGVALFFVISGFVLARPFYHQHRLGHRKVSLSYYFLRRLTRLEPPYLLCLAIYCAAFAFMFPSLRADLARHTLASAVYLHNLVYPFQPPIPDFVTWSMEIEVQFYILAPLLGQIFRIRSRLYRRVLLIVLILAGCTWSAFHTTPPVTILMYAGFFPAGFLLVDLFDDPGHLFARTAPRSLWWDLAGLPFWAAIFLLPPSLVTRSWLPVLILPAYLTVFRGTVSRWLFSRPLLTTIGGMCYSLYLLHPLVLSMAFRVIKRAHATGDAQTYFLQLSLLLLVIVPVGTMYFVLVERPCMNKRWPKELLAWVRSLRGTQTA